MPWRSAAPEVLTVIPAPATEQFAAMFAKLGGIMAERITDLRDIRDRVIAELAGLPEPMAQAQQLLPALSAVDRDDLVLGATRAARQWLDLDDKRIAAGVPASDLLREDTSGDAGELPDAERAALRRVLSRANGNVSMAAELLGISRATLYRKMKRLQVN